VVVKGGYRAAAFEQVPEYRAALAADRAGHRDRLAVVAWQLTLLGSSAAF
jgi:hypothetical protein